MKNKYRKGGHILSLDELAKQEFIYFGDKVTHKGWFGSWQLRFFERWLGQNGRIFYAEKIVPDKIVCNRCGKRFADESELKRFIEIEIAADDVVVLDYKGNEELSSEPDTEVFRGCPNCRTDADLMNLEVEE